jgi:phosphoribosyl-ATP pyrophosphohydrolase
MTDAIKLTDLKIPICRAMGLSGARHVVAVAARARPAPCARKPLHPLRARSKALWCRIHFLALRRQAPNRAKLDRLYGSLSEVTPANHPRTARLLAPRTRKTAQNVIEEAGEVALEAVKHHTQGVIRESADLLYHLVALWHRAGIDPAEVWIEMRFRADTLGIAEKLPKARSDRRNPQPTTVGEE